MAIPATLQKKIEGMSPEQLKELEQYVENCEARMGTTDAEPAEVEDIGSERAEKAEMKAMGGKTVIHSAYRGRK